MFSFCKPVSDKRRFLPHRTLTESFTFTLFSKASELPVTDWMAVAGAGSPFLHPDYLSLVEHCEHSKLQCRYVLLYDRAKPCGVIYFQIVDFNAGIFGSLMNRQVENLRERRMNLFERYLDQNKHEVLLRLFTCGNNLVSGEHGFCFQEQIPTAQRNKLLLAVTDLISREEKLRGTISATLIKDFYKPLAPERLFTDEKYHRFSVEPNMVVDLPLETTNLEQYIALFSKKYRNRAKAVIRAAQVLEVKELDLQEIKSWEEELYRLYFTVFEKAKFRLLQLPKDYFSVMKKTYATSFQLKAWFLEGKPVAFASALLMPDRLLDAHYIGFEYALNETYKLYQNILYAMIDIGFENGCSRVNLGRTAAEIKTTVGAVPQELYCYIKPQNTISGLVQRPFIAFLQPPPYTPRNPFKKEAESQEV